MDHLCYLAYTKRITTLDGVVDPVDGLLEMEPAIVNIRDNMPIHHVA